MGEAFITRRGSGAATITHAGNATTYETSSVTIDPSKDYVLSYTSTGYDSYHGDPVSEQGVCKFHGGEITQLFSISPYGTNELDLVTSGRVIYDSSRNAIQVDTGSDTSDVEWMVAYLSVEKID